MTYAIILTIVILYSGKLTVYYMPKNQLILDYEGPVTAETTELLLQQVKNDLDVYDIKKVFKKRIYSIMVECIENILRHTPNAGTNRSYPSIKLEKGDHEFRVTSTNPVLNRNIQTLRSKLDKLAKSDRKQLQKMYEEQINTETDLSKNSAGLGFITIALKSTKSLRYNFIGLTDQLSVFELQVDIPIDNTN